MKRFYALLLLLTVLLSACAAGGNGKADTQTAAQLETAVPVETTVATEPATTEAYGEVDVDLTTMSSTMVYSEVSNMITTPEDYLGKTVKMNGTFSIYDSGEKVYFACLIADATACCSQGIEFIREGTFSYPDDYPELGTEVTVTGIFDTYKEGETTYCQLIHAQMNVDA